MARLRVGLRGHWVTGAMLGGALLAACSVDTSDITFVRDDAFDVGGVGSGGKVGNGGVLNGGALNKAGSEGKSGSGSGGASTGGSKLTAGSDAGGSAPAGGTGGSGGAGGVNGGGGPQECPVVQADPMQPLLDDVNDLDPALPMVGGRIGGWYLATDDSMGTVMPAASPDMPPRPTQPGAFGSPYAMRVSGGGFTEWGVSLGMALLAPLRNAPACPYDLTRQAGLRFMLKGTVSDMIVRVQVATVQTHQPMQGGTCMGNGCGDHYGFDVPVSNDWQEVKVDFADLTQVGWGQELDFNLRESLNIEFHVNPSVTFDVWIDDLSFY
jgi:hypothetical protein